MAINETLAAKAIKVYSGIAQGSIITITSGSGATATVEYTVASPANIANNSATWVAWPRGTVAASTSIADLTNTVVSIRVTASGGTVTVDINDNPSYAALEQYEQDFLNSENRIFYHNVGGGQPSTLTNPTYQATANVDNYTQIAIQNKSATANASADQICYPDNVTSSDLTGFIDVGITSSAFSQSAYAITGQNEGYVFMSAPSGAGKTGDMVIATDSTGSANSIWFGTGGFSALANRRAGFVGAAFRPYTNASCSLGVSAVGFSKLFMDYTNTGTIGAVTINKAAGRVNVAAAATSVVVTNSYVTAASKVFCTIAQNDATAVLKNVVPAAGSFTITLNAAATANTAIDFFVVNAD